MVGKDEPVIALIDMDCFYVQVEQRARPELWGKPVAVVQYRDFRKGGIIAVGYEARKFGVRRNGMYGEDAEALCPDIALVQVPVQRGKADLTRYRDASREVFAVLQELTECVVERASIDEAYIDMTACVKSRFAKPGALDDLLALLATTHVFLRPTDEEVDRESVLGDWLEEVKQEVGDLNSPSPNLMLAMGAVIVEQIRRDILQRTQFNCSAGIAHNKMLAKLACGLHKPRQQTIMPQLAVPTFFQQINIKQVRNLGGKMGASVCELFGIEKMSELAAISKDNLVAAFDKKTGNWLYQLAQGFDFEGVVARDLPKSIGCGRNFLGKDSLASVDAVEHWLKQLSEELEERLTRDQEQNHRTAKSLSVGVKYAGERYASYTRAVSIGSYSAERLAKDSLAVIREFNKAPTSDPVLWTPPINNLSMCASRFEDSVEPVSLPITNFFKPALKMDQSFEPLTKHCVTPKPAHSRTLAPFLSKPSTSTAGLSSADLSHISRPICELSPDLLEDIEEPNSRPNSSGNLVENEPILVENEPLFVENEPIMAGNERILEENEPIDMSEQSFIESLAADSDSIALRMYAEGARGKPADTGDEDVVRMVLREQYANEFKRERIASSKANDLAAPTTSKEHTDTATLPKPKGKADSSAGSPTKLPRVKSVGVKSRGKLKVAKKIGRKSSRVSPKKNLSRATEMRSLESFIPFASAQNNAVQSEGKWTIPKPSRASSENVTSLVSPSASSERNEDDLVPWSEVDPRTFQELPLSIQWELKQFYKLQKTATQRPTASSKPNSGPGLVQFFAREK